MKLFEKSFKALCVTALIVTASPFPAAAQVTETVAKTRMIAAANPHAAKAGLDMMRAGGSAVDAAIATQLVLGLSRLVTDHGWILIAAILAIPTVLFLFLRAPTERTAPELAQALYIPDAKAAAAHRVAGSGHHRGGCG